MSWHGWSIQPPLAYVVVAALLYWLGGGATAAPRGRGTGGARPRSRSAW